MARWFVRRARFSLVVGLALLTGACGAPTGLGSDELGIEFVDGPADHVAGQAIPTFRVWVVDLFQRRATSIQSGSMSIDLLDPSGAVQAADLESVAINFGQGTFSPGLSLDPADGYRVRATFESTTGTSPPFSVVAGPDRVTMGNFPNGEVGMLVDGANNIGLLPDSMHRTTAADVDVGVLNSGALTHEVAVFPPDRRLELVPMQWTSGVDVLPIALRDRVALPITVWIVGGTFADVRTQVQAALDELDDVWRRERAGVAVGDVEYMDATSMEGEFGTFAVGLGAPFGPIADEVGRTAGRFNVYVVTSVRDGTGPVDGFGEQPGTAVAVSASAIASNGTRLLGHEIGHNFGLVHPGNRPGFEVDANMMRPDLASTFLTEGQTFRANFDRSSPLGQFRAGDTFDLRSCDPFEETSDCPELALRIWPESEPAASVVAGEARNESVGAPLGAPRCRVGAR
ncbi:MAG: hypothetical protein MJB57_06075 [Gemmatimonadetes bacterium]|nr:hypothetical protein [Gemmatimonadota bacterium]